MKTIHHTSALWLIKMGFLVIAAFAALAGASPGAVVGAANAAEQQGSGFFRDQDSLPGSYRLYLQRPGLEGQLWKLGPRKTKVRKASFKTDAHEGVADYSTRSLCVDCHRDHERDIHMSRVGVTCIQCHRDKPIAGVYQYYSSMNPIRRHAYVCAKCHEGASPSFASYMVHEPRALAIETLESFPLLGYATWLMVILAGGVFVFFLPYTALWGLRELIGKIFGGARNG